MSLDINNKDLCLYICSDAAKKPKKIWKVRCTVLKLVFLVVLCVAFVAGISFIASDYARSIIYSKFENSIKRSRNHNLARKLERLNAELNGKEGQLTKTVDSLRAIVKRAGELGLITKKNTGESSFKKTTIKNCSPQVKEALQSLGRECNPKLNSISGVSFNSNKHPQLTELEQIVERIKYIPFLAPTYGAVSSRYGYRRSPFTGNVSMHNGIDFSRPYGTKVFSTAAGLVEEVKWHSSYGLVIDINHGEGIITRYAHLSNVAVKVGQQLEPGQFIGRIGSSGRSTGSHLHYEIRIYGRSINPLRILELGQDISLLLA